MQTLPWVDSGPLVPSFVLLLGRYTSHQLLFANPAPLFLLIFFACFLLLGKLMRFTPRRAAPIFTLCGILSICAYFTIIVLNIQRAGTLWHDEANILTIAAAYTRGHLMYHPLAGPAFYSLFYGPSTFLVYAPFLAGSAHSITAIKIAVFAAALLDLALLFLLLRYRLSRTSALALLPIGTAFLLAFPLVLLGVRGDIWLLLCLSIALLSVVRLEWLGWFGAALISGIFSGLAIDFKLTVVPVVCLLLAILYRRYGLRAVAVSAVSCGASALALLSLPRVGMANYFAWLAIAGRQGFLKSTLLGNLLAAFFLVAPVLLVAVLGAPAQRRRAPGWAIPCWIVVALAACLLSGSKNGAGAWHLWPMLPFLLAGTAYEFSVRGANGPVPSSLEPASQPSPGSTNKTLAVLASIAIAGAFVTMYFAVRDFRTIQAARELPWRTKVEAAENALDAISHRPFPHHDLAMGYGATVTDYRTDLRYRLAIAGQPYFFDENAVIEGDKAGFPIPSAAIDRILGCRDIWIIPHDEIPFSTTRRGILPIHGTPYLFPDALRSGFLKTHSPFERGQVYDLWKCNSE